jgi:hypothetical protein
VASESLGSLSSSAIEASHLAIAANTAACSSSYASIEASNVAIVASASPCSVSYLSIEASNVAIVASTSLCSLTYLSIGTGCWTGCPGCWTAPIGRPCKVRRTALAVGARPR